jgi:hypothetical protein
MSLSIKFPFNIPHFLHYNILLFIQITFRCYEIPQNPAAGAAVVVAGAGVASPAGVATVAG